jgi:hypothetical protein
LGSRAGANVYGFAGGDPVNFADPFGLKSCAELQQAIDHTTRLLAGYFDRTADAIAQGIHDTGHEKQIRQRQNEIKSYIRKYQKKKCDSGPDDDDWPGMGPAREIVERPVPPAQVDGPRHGWRPRLPTPSPELGMAGLITTVFFFILLVPIGL